MSFLRSRGLKEILARIEACKERLSSGKPAPEIEELLQLETEIKDEAKGREFLERDQAALLLTVWSVLSLAFKKELDYKNSLACLKKARRMEIAMRATPLDIAVTEINIGTCYYFLRDDERSLKFSTQARDSLVQELKLMQQAKSHIASGYKKKLLLNLVVALFNRGVEYLLRGDHENHKVNINQSLELATQKFGKDEVITHMVFNMARKDKSEMMPFFVNKLVDLRNLLNEAHDKEPPIQTKDVLVREPEEDIVSGKMARSLLRNSQEKPVKVEKSKQSQLQGPSSGLLPHLKSHHKDLREASEERSHTPGPTREGKHYLPPNLGYRNGPRSVSDRREADRDPDHSPVGGKYRSGLALSESRSYTINRVSLALKYMK
jgi:tetratricopeptide (TPR) repeat protein